jgi:hypothetical protein
LKLFLCMVIFSSAGTLAAMRILASFFSARISAASEIAFTCFYNFWSARIANWGAARRDRYSGPFSAAGMQNFFKINARSQLVSPQT